MGIDKFPDLNQKSSKFELDKLEFDTEELNNVCAEMDQAINNKKMHPSQPIWWGNRLIFSGSNPGAKISSDWTEVDRANALAMLGKEMVDYVNGSGKTTNETLVQWLERITFIANRPAEFLEANRKNIVEFKK